MTCAESSPATALLDNPFLILELDPDCSRAEVERAGQKLMAMLEVGLAGADRYPTPRGDRPRDADSVREAMAQLRDPQRRLYHELWVSSDAAPVQLAADFAPGLEPSGDPDFDPPTPSPRASGFAALRALGWRR